MLPARTLFAFALAREAKPFRRRCPNKQVIVTGTGPVQAAEAITRAIAIEQPPMVVIAGFAGALKAAINVGDVITASHVIDLSSKRELSHPGADSNRLVSADRIIGSTNEKRQLAHQFDAAAVDMETFAIAGICTEQRIPWLAVRAISDRADTALSPELIDLIAKGRVSIRNAVTSVLRRPSLLIEFRRLARDTRLAANRLADYLASC